MKIHIAYPLTMSLNIKMIKYTLHIASLILTVN